MRVRRSSGCVVLVWHEHHRQPIVRGTDIILGLGGSLKIYLFLVVGGYIWTDTLGLETLSLSLPLSLPVLSVSLSAYAY